MSLVSLPADPTKSWTNKEVEFVLGSLRFREHLQVAGELSKAEGVSPPAARVVWVTLVFGIFVGRRYACRNMKSKAARAWAQLRKAGCLDHQNNRLGWDAAAEHDPLAWLFLLMRVASR
jgi:hypothetical protein